MSNSSQTASGCLLSGDPYPSDMCGIMNDVPVWVKAHTGASLVLVFGCGPSLDKMPAEFWLVARNYLSCGVNGFPILKPVAENDFNCDIWLCIDALREQEKSYPNQRQFWVNKRPEDKPLRLMASANRGSSESDLYFEHTRFWLNKRGVCKFGRSAVQAAINWIVTECHPKRIALFGVDYSGPGRAGGLEGNTSHQHGDRLEETFDEMLSDAFAGGTQLVNCSPNSRLMAIPKAGWETIL